MRKWRQKSFAALAKFDQPQRFVGRPLSWAAHAAFFIMTLKELMTADVSKVILNEDDFGTEIEWYPKGVLADKQLIIAVVFEDALEGTREVHGDGRTLHSDAGTNLRESVTLVISTDHLINSVKGGGNHGVDQFVVRGKRYTVKRVTGRNDDMQKVLCVRTRVTTTRRGERRG